MEHTPARIDSVRMLGLIEAFGRRGVPATAVVTMVAVSATSNLNLPPAPAGATLWFTYVAVLAYLTFSSAPLPKLHRVGAVLAVFAWGSRSLAFLELVFIDGRTDLIGSIFERALVAWFLFVWHLRLAEIDTIRKHHGG